MWSSQLTPFLEISAWLSHGLIIVVALLSIASVYSLKR